MDAHYATSSYNKPTQVIFLIKKCVCILSTTSHDKLLDQIVYPSVVKFILLVMGSNRMFERENTVFFFSELSHKKKFQRHLPSGKPWLPKEFSLKERKKRGQLKTLKTNSLNPSYIVQGTTCLCHFSMLLLYA
jgi:hypothetical protein